MSQIHVWSAAQSVISRARHGVDSPIGKRGFSRETWLGGDMPPKGPTSAPDAEQAIQAWVAAGALNN